MKFRPGVARRRADGTRLVVAGLLLAFGIFGAGAALAQDSGEHPTFDRSPDQGPPGTVIKVSGTGCIYYGKPWEYAYVYFYRIAGDGGPPFDGMSNHYTIKADGSWEGDLIIPQEAPLGNYKLVANCKASDMNLRAGEHPFKVTDPSSPPPSLSPSLSPSPKLSPGPKLSPSASPTPSPLATASPSLPSLMPDDKKEVGVTLTASSENKNSKAGPLAIAGVAAIAAGLSAALLIYLRRARRQ